MPITLRESGGNYTPPPEGTILAVCFRIVDVGMQPDSGFGEKEKICISWELPTELIETQDGQQKPMGVSKTYTKSLNPKSNLRRDLERWRSRQFTAEELKGFELRKILGKGCQLSIIHETDSKTGKVRAKIDGVFAPPKGLGVPAPVNPMVEYSLEQGKDKVYQALPEWIRNMVDFGLARKAAEAAPGNVDNEPEPPLTEPEGGESVPF